MNPAGLIVITDLDGTLLDQESYRYDAALPAVRRLQALRVPLVLCSSKTRREIEPLRRELGLDDPFISENGGAIYFAPGTFSPAVPGAVSKGALQAVELGKGVALLRRALGAAAAACGVAVRSFGAMTPEEVSRLTGLTPEQTLAAMKREYDEPFLVEGAGRDRLVRALKDEGFGVTYGGRFFHITGGHDKGRAVELLLDLYRKANPGLASAGLGNAANDLPLLARVDRPVLVRNPDLSYDAEVLRAMPGIERTEECGPQGWRIAVEKILAEGGRKRGSESPAGKTG